MNQKVLVTPKTLEPLSFPLAKHALIEASAGTGKTFTIAFLYVRLVLGHGYAQSQDLSDNSILAQGLLPKQILVVTFTEAATKELVDRIRSNLSLAAEVFSDDPQIPESENVDLLEALKNTYPSEFHSSCRKKLLDALELMDEASISTIHAWCNRMLAEHAFDSGSLFQLSLETNQQSLKEQAAKDYWREYVYPLSGDELALAVKALGSPTALLSVIKDSLNRLHCFDKPHNRFAVLAQIDALLEDVRSQDWDALISDAEHFIAEHSEPLKMHKGHVVKPINTVLGMLREWSNGTNRHPDKLGSSKGYEKLTTEGFKSVVNQRAPLLPICQQVDKLFTLQALETGAKFPLYEHAAHCISELIEKQQQSRGELGFDGLLIELHKALVNEAKAGSDRLATTIARQFPVALIDEFQDTDQIQFGIFENIYFRKNSQTPASLLMIGDPKQAIYSFRGGDIYTYLKAAEAVGEHKYTLSTNYRSTHSMVSAVNVLFERAEERTEQAFNFSYDEYKDSAHNPIPFYPVKSQGLKTQFVIEGQPPKSLVMWQHFNENDKGKLTSPTVDVWRNDMAQACASTIVDILQLSMAGKAYFSDRRPNTANQPVLPSDIAILVNEKKEAKAIKDALLAKNLNSVYLSTRGSVLDTQVAKDVLFWLKAIAEPTRISLIRNALGTQSINKSFTELQGLVEDESYIDAIVQQFNVYQQLWKSKDVLPMLRKFMLDFDIHNKVLESGDGERNITDLLHIGELLQQASMKLDGMENLISYYENAVNAEQKDEVEFNKPRLESDSDLIKVVTVHKSKGLQYPLVFLPFATKPAEIFKFQRFFAYHKDGELQASFDPKEAKSILSEELAQEDIRKLYVGLTRAKYATWVGVANNSKWNESGLAYLLGTTSKDQHVNQALQELAQAYPDDIEVLPLPEATELSYTPAQKADLGEALHPSNKVQQLWNTFSYSSIQYASNDGAKDIQLPTFNDERSNIDPKTAEQLSENNELPSKAVSAAISEGLTSEFADVEAISESEQALTLHSFYRGAKPGTFLHNILEWACKTGFGVVNSEPELLRQHVHKHINNAGWQEYEEVVYQWMHELIAQGFDLSGESNITSHDNEIERGNELENKGNKNVAALSDLALCVAEMEFWFSTHAADLLKIDALVQAHTLDAQARSSALPFSNFASSTSRQASGSGANLMSGIFKGFIDLSFEHQGKYYVLDYKSNYLGDSDDAYTQENMQASIIEHRYDLQFVIYLVALHRLLKQRLVNYDYDSDVGGCIYYFLRGYKSQSQGIFSVKPPLSLIEAVDDIFAGSENKHNEAIERESQSELQSKKLDSASPQQGELF
jgi:exodeoxyribonuclease V beta subunit